jgi:hypothetical protein
MDTLVVAEGIETPEDLIEVGRAGIELVQANILCPAMPIGSLLAAGFRAPGSNRLGPMEVVAPDVTRSSRPLGVAQGQKATLKLAGLVAP